MGCRYCKNLPRHSEDLIAEAGYAGNLEMDCYMVNQEIYFKLRNEDYKTDEYDGEILNASIYINYCPFCGEELRKFRKVNC